LREVSLFEEIPHHGNRIGIGDRVMLRFVSLHQQGEEFDCFLLIWRRVF